MTPISLVLSDRKDRTRLKHHVFAHDLFRKICNFSDHALSGMVAQKGRFARVFGHQRNSRFNSRAYLGLSTDKRRAVASAPLNFPA
jgi:hypothetical protein